MEMLVTWVLILAALSVTQFCFELRKLKRVEDDTVREFASGGGSGDRQDDEMLTICGDDQQCLEFDTQRLKVLYRNLFQTQEQLDMTRRKSKSDRDDILRSESAGIVDTEVLDSLQGDGDSCCPT
ncbi:hypothetical protein MAR_037633 [Mya arenaria]|uniref:Uncharacterized protein n=2 Tax=Mya arenaria TaxID=6604 RepID=A0ABY7FS39_MYAAR|nr:hypothetical protein MAR_037633 [Mya arenaria]